MIIIIINSLLLLLLFYYTITYMKLLTIDYDVCMDACIYVCIYIYECMHVQQWYSKNTPLHPY